MARPPKDQKPMSIRLDAKLREKADAVKAETGETLTELIEDGLARAIKARQRKLRQARRG
jgi:antitoxin component of RelBE/YafQ-DinJ toxin-antitoxin module